MRPTLVAACAALCFTGVTASDVGGCKLVKVHGDDSGATHTVCTPADGLVARSKLVVHFCGSGGRPPAPSQVFVAHVRSLGFHFIGVNYANSPSVASFCSAIADVDPDCFEKTRLARLFGGDYQGTHIDPHDGGVNRLQRVLADAATQHPEDGWGSFRLQDGTPQWRSIVATGHSQGAGMALLLGQRHVLDRVVQLAGVDDVLPSSGAAAPWIARRGWATSVDRIYGLANTKGFCCQMWHTNWPAAGMLGTFTSVDVAKAPFGGARQLCSSADVPNGHGAPLTDTRYAEAWTYMLTSNSSSSTGLAAHGLGRACDCPSGDLASHAASVV